MRLSALLHPRLRELEEPIVAYPSKGMKVMVVLMILALLFSSRRFELYLPPEGRGGRRGAHPGWRGAGSRWPQ